MDIYDLGDVATFPLRVYDTTGTLTDATVGLSVTLPDGTTQNPSVTHVSTGTYTATATLSQNGAWFWKYTISGTVVGVESGQIFVADPKPLLYCSLDDVKHRLRIPTSDTADDAEILDKITRASRRVDKDCGRPRGFGRDKATSKRIYRPHHEELLSIDDVATATGLVVEIGRDNTWSVVDSSLWDTLPENAEVDGRAIETIRRLVGQWPMWGLQRIRVTAIWGWPYVPDSIKEATELLTARLVRRKDSPEGVKGFSDLGVVRVARYDSDYDNLIDAYKRDAT